MDCGDDIYCDPKVGCEDDISCCWMVSRMTHLVITNIDREDDSSYYLKFDLTPTVVARGC